MGVVNIELFSEEEREYYEYTESNFNSYYDICYSNIDDSKLYEGLLRNSRAGTGRLWKAYVLIKYILLFRYPNMTLEEIEILIKLSS